MNIDLKHPWRLDDSIRVIFFLGHPNPFPGAAWTRIHFFADSWSRKGHAIEIVGAFGYETFSSRGAKNQGKVNVLNLAFRIGLNHPLVFLLNGFISFVISTLFLISRKPDVVIVSVPTGDTGLGSLLSSILLRKRVVVDYRDDWEDYTILETQSAMSKRIYRVIKRFAVLVYTRASMAVSVTPTWVAALRDAGIEKVYLIPNGADVKTFRPLGANEIRKVRHQLGLSIKCFIVLFTGTLAKYYMLSETLKAFAEFLRRNKHVSAKLLLITNAERAEKYRNEIMAMSRGLGIEKLVAYLSGTCDHSKLSRLMASADVGLIPLDKQRGHVWPAKFFEYCACGIPVIATVQPDSILGKLIHTYEVGVTVSANDHVKLASALTKIYKDGSFRSKARMRARQMVIQNFDRNKSAKELLGLVTESAG